jgi:type VI secretion system protein ImpH
MDAPDRPAASDLTPLGRLTARPTQHHIFLALRILEAAYPDAPPLGQSRRPREDRVRLGQTPRMAFPPSTIDAFKPARGDKPARLSNLFFGLFGPNGPLPLHLTEYARERQTSYRDPTFTAFADMLTHRLMSLLYRAWVTGQPAAAFDRPGKGRIDGRIAALAGHAGRGL